MQIEIIYPNQDDPSEEYSFEELRAKKRYWLDSDWDARMKAEKRQWAGQKVNEKPNQIRHALVARNVQAQVLPTETELASDEINLADHMEQALMINDENAPPPQTTKTQKIQIFNDENVENVRSKTGTTVSKKQKMQIFADENMDMRPPPVPSQTKVKTVPLRVENGISTAQTDRDAELARRLRKEERANRTRKVKVREVKRDDQTSKLSGFDSFYNI